MIPVIAKYTIFWSLLLFGLVVNIFWKISSESNLKRKKENTSYYFFFYFFWGGEGGEDGILWESFMGNSMGKFWSMMC